jgi:hypothetical protein
MSPEQLSGDKLDGKSDLYSLALVYFRMLTGHLPFQAETVQETMIKRLTDEPKKLAEVRPDLTFPSGLQPVLDGALARTPAERYQTVAKFADDVLGVVQLVRATRGGVAPATRAVAEERTQLVDSHETKAQTARRREAEALARPVLVGVIVVLAAGGGDGRCSGGTPRRAGRLDSADDARHQCGRDRPRHHRHHAAASAARRQFRSARRPRYGQTHVADQPHPDDRRAPGVRRAGRHDDEPPQSGNRSVDP